MYEVVYDEEFMELLPSKWWANFFKKFNQINDVPVHEWKPIHQLSYFCYRFYQHYGKKYSFSLRGQPSKCPEIFLIKKAMACLGTSNQKTIREYIDWVFDYHIIPKDRKIRSVGFLSNPELCNEFHLHRKEANKITRAKELPDEYKSIISGLGLSLDTYGDLAFAKQALDQNPESHGIYETMFKKLYSIGFEYKMIERLA